MKSIDAEIAAVEQRIDQRKLALASTTRAAKRKAARTVGPPLAVVGALALGLFVAQRVRHRGRRSEPVVAQDTKEQSKGFALGTLLMTGATWFIRSQFGGPVGLAQFVLSRLHGSRPPATAVSAEHPPQVRR